MFKEKMITLLIFLILILSVTCLPSTSSIEIKKKDNYQKLEQKDTFEKEYTKKISNKNKENINQKSILHTFLSKIKSIKNLSDNEDLTNRINIDNETIFLILFVIWVFVNGGLAICLTDIFPYAVMFMEAIFFGLVGSVITGILFNMDNHPLLEGTYNMINNSTILNSMPVMKNMMLGMINLSISLIDSNSATIIAATGWTISTATLGAFLYIFQNVMIVKLITSGIWFIMPYIVWKIIELINELSEDSDQDQGTVFSINMIKFFNDFVKNKKDIV